MKIGPVTPVRASSLLLRQVQRQEKISTLTTLYPLEVSQHSPLRQLLFFLLSNSWCTARRFWIHGLLIISSCLHAAFLLASTRRLVPLLPYVFFPVGCYGSPKTWKSKFSERIMSTSKASKRFTLQSSLTGDIQLRYLCGRWCFPGKSCDTRKSVYVCLHFLINNYFTRRKRGGYCDVCCSHRCKCS